MARHVLEQMRELESSEEVSELLESEPALVLLVDDPPEGQAGELISKQVSSERLLVGGSYLVVVHLHQAVKSELFVLKST